MKRGTKINDLSNENNRREIQDRTSHSTSTWFILKDCASVENFRSFEHLTRLLKEQAVATKDGNVKPVEGGKLTSQILQNPSDPDATFRHKAGESHIGHSLNFVEVYDNKTDMGLIMNANVKENIYSDAQYGEDFVKNHPLAKEIDTLAVDGAYYRQETIKHAEELGLEINFSQMTGRSVEEDVIGVDQFKIDAEIREITACPQGHQPIFSLYNEKKQVYTAKFYKDHCLNCPLLEQCQVKEQKRAYHISFSENKIRTDQTRSKIGTDRHQELSNYRAGVGEFHPF